MGKRFFKPRTQTVAISAELVAFLIDPDGEHERHRARLRDEEIEIPDSILHWLYFAKPSERSRIWKGAQPLIAAALAKRGETELSESARRSAEFHLSLHRRDCFLRPSKMRKLCKKGES